MINIELIQIEPDLFCIKSLLMDNNTYIVVQNKQCIVIDPSFNEEAIKQFLKQKTIKLSAIILTHCHYDHSWAVSALENTYHCPVYAHKLDQITYEKYDCAHWIQRQVPKIQKINWISQPNLFINKFKFKIILTPGHTSGSICVSYNHYLFTGDTLFANGFGRYDFPNSSFYDLQKSIDKIYTDCPKTTLILPGHGEWDKLMSIPKPL